MQIMNELGRTTAEQELSSIDVQLKGFPYPPYYDDPFVVLFLTLMPPVIVMNFMVIASVICSDVVLEKEKKLKVDVPSRMLRMHLDLSVSTEVYWTEFRQNFG